AGPPPRARPPEAIRPRSAPARPCRDGTGALRRRRPPPGRWCARGTGRGAGPGCGICDSSRLQHLRDRVDVGPPARDLGFELAPPLVGEPVELGPPVVLRQPPFRLDPPLVLQAVEGLIESRVFEPQGAIAPLADRP